MESTQILSQVIDLEEAEAEEIPGVAPQLVKVARLTIDGVDHDVWNRINTIGRASDCDIIIENEAVSSKHAIIEATSCGLHKITDLGSTNKTRINRIIIPPKVPKTIENGTTLRIANVDAVYQYIPPDQIFAPDIKTIPRRQEADVIRIPGTPEEENASTVGHIPETPSGKSEPELKSEDDIFGIDSSLYSSSDFACSMAELRVEFVDAPSKKTRLEPSNTSIAGGSERAPTPHSSPENSQEIIAGSQALFCPERENERLIIQTAETQLTDRFPVEVSDIRPTEQPSSNDWYGMDAATQLQNPAPTSEANRETSLAGVGDISFSSMLTQVKNEKVGDPVASSNGDESFSNMLTQPRNPASPTERNSSNNLDDMDAATQMKHPAPTSDSNLGAFRPDVGKMSFSNELPDFIGEEVAGLVASSDGEESISDVLTQPRDPISNLDQSSIHEAPDEINISDIETQQIVGEVHVNHCTESRNIEDRIGAMNERNIYSAATQELMRSAIKRTTTFELLEMLENSETPSTQGGVTSKPIGRHDSQIASKHSGQSDSQLMQPPSSRIKKPTVMSNEDQPSRPSVFQSGILLMAKPMSLKREDESEPTSCEKMSITSSKTQGTSAISNGEVDSGNPAIEAPATRAEESFSEMLTQVHSPVTNQAIHSLHSIADVIDITDMETQEIVPTVHQQSCSGSIKVEGPLETVNDSDIYSAATEEATSAFEKLPSLHEASKNSNVAGSSQFLTPKAKKPIAQSDESLSASKLTKFQSKNILPEGRLSIGEKTSTLPNNSIGKLPQTPSSDFELNIDDSISDIPTQVRSPNNAQLQSPKVDAVIDITDMETQQIVPRKPYPACEKIEGRAETMNDNNIYLADTEELAPAAVIKESTSDKVPEMLEHDGKLTVEKRADENDSPMIEASQFPIARVTKPIVYSDDDSPLISQAPRLTKDDHTLQKRLRSKNKSDTKSSNNEPSDSRASREIQLEETTDVLSEGLVNSDARGAHVVSKSNVGLPKKNREMAALNDSEPSQLLEGSQFPAARVTKPIVYSDEVSSSLPGQIEIQSDSPPPHKPSSLGCEKQSKTSTRLCNPEPLSSTHKSGEPEVSNVQDGKGDKLEQALSRLYSMDTVAIEDMETQNIVEGVEDTHPLGLLNCKDLTEGLNNGSTHSDTIEEVRLSAIQKPMERRDILVNEGTPDVLAVSSFTDHLADQDNGVKLTAQRTVEPTDSPPMECSQFPIQRVRGRIAYSDEDTPPTEPVKIRKPTGSPKKRLKAVKESETPLSPSNAEAESIILEPSTTLAELQPSPPERHERPRKQAIMSCNAEKVKKATSKIELQSDEDSPPVAGRMKQRRKAQTPKKRPSAEKDSEISSSPCNAKVGLNDPGPSTSSLVELTTGSPDRRERPRKQAFMSCEAENVKKATLFDHGDSSSDPKMELSHKEGVTPPINMKKFKRAPSIKYPCTDLMNAFENESPILDKVSALPAKRQKITAPHEQTTPKIVPGPSAVSESNQPTWTSPLSRRGKKLSVKQHASVSNIESTSSPPKSNADLTPPAPRRKAKVNQNASKKSDEPPKSEPPLPQRVSARVKKAKALPSTSLPNQDAIKPRPAAEVREKSVLAASTFKRPARRCGSLQVLPDSATLETTASDTESNSQNLLGSRRSPRQRKKKKPFDDLVSQKEEEIKQKKIAAKPQSSTTPSSSAENTAQSSSDNVPVTVIASNTRSRRGQSAVATTSGNASIEPPQKRTRNSQASMSSQDSSVPEMESSQSQTLPDGRRLPRQRRKKLSFDELVLQKEEEIKQRKSATKSRRVSPSPVASTSELQLLNSSEAPATEENVRSRRSQSNSSTHSQSNFSCEPPPKRARNSQATPSTSLARNSWSMDEPPRVMFTSHIDDSKLRTIVKKFGGKVANQPKNCTVLITDKVRRTANFLSVLALGKPIVSPNWLSKCKAFNGFTDPFESLLIDPENEQAYNFSLVDSLGKSQNRRLLKDYTIYVTPSVLPPPKEMQQIIECSGGRFEKKLPTTWRKNSVVISNPNDSSSWRLLTKKGVCPPILSAEAILSGVLRQEFNPLENRLR